MNKMNVRVSYVCSLRTQQGMRMIEPVEGTAGTVATGWVDTGYHSTEETAAVGCCYCWYQSSAAYLNRTPRRRMVKGTHQQHKLEGGKLRA